ncbi:hypothetical protein ACS0TY_010598 [Phlomoides rotata]
MLGQEMIIASETGSPKSSKEKLFLYDIVANGRNEIDVDKFDHIVVLAAIFSFRDDTILKTIETSSSQDLKESRDLVLRIQRRDLYQFCNEFAVSCN